MYRIALLGDVMLGRLVDEYITTHSPKYVWGDVAPLLRHVDMTICNLECVIADRGREWTETSKTFHFRSKADHVAALMDAGVSAVTLANNHSFDYGAVGLEDMLEILDKEHIAHTGAGLDIHAAKQPAVLHTDIGDIHLLSFSDDMPEWEAGKRQPGIFHVPPTPQSRRWQELLELVRRAKQQSSLLIVSPHWGPNWGQGVEQLYVDWAQRILDAGADMIFGHSGHVFRGIELYKNKPIIYSAGDFINDYTLHATEPNDEGFVYVAEIADGAIQRLKLYPTVVEHFQANLAGARASGIAQRMVDLSAPFGTSTVRYGIQSHVLEIPLAAARLVHTTTPSMAP